MAYNTLAVIYRFWDGVSDDPMNDVSVYRSNAITVFISIAIICLRRMTCASNECHNDIVSEGEKGREQHDLSINRPTTYSQRVDCLKSFDYVNMLRLWMDARTQTNGVNDSISFVIVIFWCVSVSVRTNKIKTTEKEVEQKTKRKKRIKETKIDSKWTKYSSSVVIESKATEEKNRWTMKRRMEKWWGRTKKTTTQNEKRKQDE